MASSFARTEKDGSVLQYIFRSKNGLMYNIRNSFYSGFSAGSLFRAGGKLYPDIIEVGPLVDKFDLGGLEKGRIRIAARLLYFLTMDVIYEVVNAKQPQPPQPWSWQPFSPDCGPA